MPTILIGIRLKLQNKTDIGLVLIYKLTDVFHLQHLVTDHVFTWNPFCATVYTNKLVQPIVASATVKSRFFYSTMKVLYASFTRCQGDRLQKNKIGNLLYGNHYLQHLARFFNLKILGSYHLDRSMHRA